jgi:hypothetical protein
MRVRFLVAFVHASDWQSPTLVYDDIGETVFLAV